MKEMWDKRYQENKSAYGIEPNKEFEVFLSKKAPGNILLPGEGEGRNAVFAAKSGWNVDAFDYSIEGKIKALELAKKNNVKLNFSTTDVSNYRSKKKYDVIALIYLHLPPDIRSEFHRSIEKLLKPKGIVFIQAFSKNQLGNKSGGPQNETLLYSIEELENDFKYLEITNAKYHQVSLNEGPFHKGIAENITFIGKLTR